MVQLFGVLPRPNWLMTALATASYTMTVAPLRTAQKRKSSDGAPSPSPIEPPGELGNVEAAPVSMFFLTNPPPPADTISVSLTHVAPEPPGLIRLTNANVLPSSRMWPLPSSG